MFAFLVRKILFSIFLQILTGFTQVYKNNELKKKKWKTLVAGKTGCGEEDTQLLDLRKVCASK